MNRNIWRNYGFVWVLWLRDKTMARSVYELQRTNIMFFYPKVAYIDDLKWLLNMHIWRFIVIIVHRNFNYKLIK